MSTNQAAARWVLDLRGNEDDLNLAASMYGDGSDPRISEFDDKAHRFYGLTSTQFDSLDTPREVHEIGLRLVNLINGSLFILDGRRRPLLAGNVREPRANGGWNYNLIAETGNDEIRLYAPVVSLNGAPATPPPCASWTAIAISDNRVAEMLIHLSGEPDWADLYKAFEIMRADINKRFGQHKQTSAGWPAKSILDHFTKSANVYRHSSEKGGPYTPNMAMTLAEGQTLVRELAEIWLKNRQTP